MTLYTMNQNKYPNRKITISQKFASILH